MTLQKTLACALMLGIVLFANGVFAEDQSSDAGGSANQIVVPRGVVTDANAPRVIMSKKRVAIAEPFMMRIEVVAPAGRQVRFQTMEQTLGAFNVLDVTDTPDVPVQGADSDERLWIRTINLETLQFGTQTIPPVEVTVQASDDAAVERTRKSEPVAIEVVSVLDPEEQAKPDVFRDIEGEISLQDESNSASGFGALWWLPVSIVAGVLGCVAVVWSRRRDRSMRWCRNQLNELKDRSLNAPTEYVDAADSLKRVLQVSVVGASGMSAPAISGTRLIEMLSEQGYGEPELKRLRLAFAGADRLKFDSRRDQNVPDEVVDAFRDAVDDAVRCVIARREPSSPVKENA
ncbi:membrane protein [Rhodopirellula sp. SWK7]|uniref:membrane protein n=1 Tax=Rhodopirellula sp. SWK7 TaxID=595460 RepID=UPI0002BF24E3|nr:membrane protein [Rhodopirellula sp. SWK7]EMI41956.1 putative membrane protein [Rhodopirellula sp. SWK7]